MCAFTEVKLTLLCYQTNAQIPRKKCFRTNNPSISMPARKCAPKRKPAAKRKSSTTGTRRPSSATKRPSTATRRRSSACATRSRSRTVSASSSCAPCRDPYMLDEAARCGPVACVDEYGRQLKGFVRNKQGECVPKNCGPGYVFNYATGKCVTQNSYHGQHLLRVKKFNEAVQAKVQAQRIIDNYNPDYDKDEKLQKTYGSMLGGINEIAAAQRDYDQEYSKFLIERQQQFATQQEKALRRRAKSTTICAPTQHRPLAKSDSHWASMWTH